MGDRANIVINSQGGNAPRIFLYTHWAGCAMPKILSEALNRGSNRLDDESCLTRIIFNQMTMGYEEETTGFGISSYLCDNEHPLIIVDVETQSVWLENEEQTKATKPIKFSDFLKIGHDWNQIKISFGDIYHEKNIVETV